MRIDVGNILAEGEGFRKSFDIADEAVELEDLTVSGPINGHVTVCRTSSGVSLHGAIQLKLLLECHRCLCEYKFFEDFSISGNFSERPSALDLDVWPISPGQTIDIAPLIRQEAILGIPLKQLCRADCPGLTNRR